MHKKILIILLTLMALFSTVALALADRENGAKNSREVNLQILAINDFHGSIATTSGAFGGVGRADFLAANIRAAEAEADNSITVSAGDLIGASPLISALFHDEPTIEAMNLIGLDINGVDNHEFDEGPAELLRMQNGGSHPVDGDHDGDPFLGADFEFLAANVVVDETGETLFPAYTIRNYQGVKVAFIGMTLEGTPSIVTPNGVAGLTFQDEVDTVNALIPQLQQNNIEAIVVLMHEGGFASEGGGNGDGCGTLSGNLADIVDGLDDAGRPGDRRPQQPAIRLPEPQRQGRHHGVPLRPDVHRHRRDPQPGDQGHDSPDHRQQGELPGRRHAG